MELSEKDLIRKRLKEQGKDSAHNSEDEGEREARENQKDEEAENVIKYNYLGSEECPIDEA